MLEKFPYKEQRAEFIPNKDTHSSWLGFVKNGASFSKRSYFCYAPLRNIKATDLFLFFGETTWRKKGTKEWVDWILNRSFFADAFLTKNVDEASTLGISVDTRKDWAYVLGSMMVLRHQFEFLNTFTWAEFVELGLSEFDAYVAACNVYLQDDYLAKVDCNRNHFPLYGNISYDHYLGRHLRPAGVPMSKGGSQGCRSLSAWHWIDREGDEWDTPISVSIKKYKLTTKTVVVENPFGPDEEQIMPEASLDNLNKIINYHKGL